MNKICIIKIGGRVIEDPVLLGNWIMQLNEIKKPKIIIHGGGVMADELSEKLNIPVKKVNGRRITNEASRDVAVMVYAGLSNKKIVAAMQVQGINAVGLSGADGALLRAVRRPVKDVDYGFVGDLSWQGVNTHLLKLLLNEGITPVICAISASDSGELLNTNADAVAAHVAMAMAEHGHTELYYCFEKEGVLSGADGAVIQGLSQSDIDLGIKNGSLKDGIIPKVELAMQAKKFGVNRVCIGAADSLVAMWQKTGLFTEVI